jgi:hypothetical protein
MGRSRFSEVGPRLLEHCSETVPAGFSRVALSHMHRVKIPNRKQANTRLEYFSFRPLTARRICTVREFNVNLTARQGRAAWE